MANEHPPHIHPPMVLTPAQRAKAADPAVAPPESIAKPIQLQRRRVWRACESCRRKKIKCDGHEPTCGQCVAARLQCQWSQTKDRAALSRHYVQELEARLIEMEGVLRQMSDTGKQSTPASTLPLAQLPTSPAHNKASSPSNSSSSSPNMTNNRIKREEPDPSMSEKFGQLALDEHQHARWLGPSSTISLISSFRALTNSGVERITPTSPSDDGYLAPESMSSLYFPRAVMFGKFRKSTALPSVEEAEFPPVEEADRLINTYFARYHFLVPILDKPSFLQSYKELKENDFQSSDASFLSILFAVFACASRLVADPRVPENTGRFPDDTGMIFYERGLMLHYIGHAQIQVGHVQCLALLASFLCSANCLPQAWLLIGQALRTAQDLGLHRSPQHLSLSPIDKETRRKVWWNVYCLDRMLAVALGRPMGVEDVDCDVELPLDFDDEELPIYFSGSDINRLTPSLMTGFVAIIRLYTIVGRLLRQVYALRFCKDDLEPEVAAELQMSVDNLDRQLDEWCEELPACFKSQPANDQQISMGAVLCSSWYAVRITLHRNFLPVKRNSSPPPGSTSASKAISAARSCIFLAGSIQNVIPPSHHLAFFIQYLFSSAVIILLCAIHAQDDNARAMAMNEAHNCLNYLADLEGIWPGAKKCKDLLSELATATRLKMNHDASKDKESPPTLAPAPVTQAQGSPSNRSLHATPSPNVVHVEPSRPSHRMSKTKHRAHSKRRSMSQKRLRDEPESPKDFTATPPDREMPIRTNRRNSMTGRSPSVSRRSRRPVSQIISSQTPVFSETAPEPANRGMASLSQALFEVPSGPANVTIERSPSYLPDHGQQQTQPGWIYDTGEWNLSSPVENQTGRDREFTYGNNSQLATMDFGGDDTLGLNGANYTAIVDHNGSQIITPFEQSEGLPFAGLEFLHSYTPNNESNTMELWNSWGPTAFEYSPDVPFAFTEGNGF